VIGVGAPVGSVEAVAVAVAAVAVAALEAYAAGF